MPDYFTHVICADEILERLDRAHRKRITDRPLYLLGAQGGDVFFAYNMKFSKTNLGRWLHAQPALELFEKLDGADPSYVAGFATHYVLDCTLHPAIYAFESVHRSPFSHINFENDLGLYVSRKFATPRRILPRETVEGATFTVYDCIRRVNGDITLTGVERCLKRHFSYTRLVYKNKRQTYKYDYNYSSLAPAVDEAVGLGVRAVGCVLDNNLDPDIFSKQFLQH